MAGSCKHVTNFRVKKITANSLAIRSYSEPAESSLHSRTLFPLLSPFRPDVPCVLCTSKIPARHLCTCLNYSTGDIGVVPLCLSTMHSRHTALLTWRLDGNEQLISFSLCFAGKWLLVLTGEGLTGSHSRSGFSDKEENTRQFHECDYEVTIARREEKTRALQSSSVFIKQNSSASSHLENEVYRPLLR